MNEERPSQTPPLPAPSFLKQITEEFRWSRLVPAITVGLLAALLQLMLAISMAALIFRGALTPYLIDGIGFALISAVIGGGAVVLLTSTPGIISGNQDVPAAIMALATLSLAQALPASASGRQLFMTVVVLIGLTTALMGLCFYLLGRYRLGNLVRFLPYPVIGGFLAGTGWLLLSGGIEIMVDMSPSAETIGRLLQPAMLLHWLPGLLLAAFLVLLLKRTTSKYALPATVLGSVVLFYLIALLSGASLPSLSAGGWLLGPFPQQAMWRPVPLSDLGLVHWPAIIGQAPNIITVVLMSAITMLLNSSGLELVLNKDVALDQELRAAGIGNMLSGMAGGFITFQQASISALVIRSGSSGRLAGLVGVAVCLVMLFAGASLLSYFPKIVLGGLVAYLGLSFIVDTLVNDWAKLPRADYFVIVLILIITASVGFMEAVAVGLLVAIILFIVNYSRIDIVRNELTGRTAQSRVTRSPEKQQALIESGDQLLVFRLQGFIFFGTADALVTRIRERIDDRSRTALRYLLLDFRHVSGVDATALVLFDKLLAIARSRRLTILLTQPVPQLALYMEQAREPDCDLHIFPDLDHGLEWCEAQRLFSDDSAESDRALHQILADRLGSAQTAAQLLAYFERQELPTGYTLMQQGAAPDTLFFVESGRISAYLHEADGRDIRLQTMQDWNVLGEIGFFLGTARTASVAVETPGVVYCLSKEALQRMQEEDSHLASTLHHLIVQLLAERVVHLVSVVDALQR